MKKLNRISKILALAGLLVFGLTACGNSNEEKSSDSLVVDGSSSATKESSAGAGDTAELANDYYIDLTDLGMKLTIYLRLDDTGNFLFSNTLDFETNKSSGTFQKSEDAYMMVYSSVNGEEKSISDGLTTTFKVLEDGSLDFTGEAGCIYYGIATATSTSADDPDAKMIAYVVPEDYEAPETGTDFQTGVYVTDDVNEAGTSYSHVVSFYEDGSFLHMMIYKENDQMVFVSENGGYSVSTTQLALEPGDGGHSDRISCEVVDEAKLKLSVLPYAGASERTELDFTKTDTTELVAEFTGTGTVKGSDETFEVTAALYADGSYESVAADFTETGILVINSAEKFVKQYPDHPETGVRGLNQVTTVPSGEISSEDGKITIAGLRVRKSAGLNRHECTVVQQNE